MTESPLMDYTAAAQWLGVPKSWLEREVQAGRAPHTRLGKHVRFTRYHLDQLVTSNERGVKVVAPPAPAMTLKPSPKRRKAR